MRRFSAGLLLLLVLAPPARAQTPPHLEIQLWLDPDRRYLRATVRSTVFESGSVAVDLAPWLTLSSLEVDGRPVAIERRPTMRVDLGEGPSHELLFAYEGIAPAAGGDSHDDEAAALFHIGDDGTYLPGGGGWLPSVGARHVTYRLEMSVPEPSRVIASGRLAEERSDGGRYTAVVTHTHPGDEPSVFAGPYAVRERWHRGVRLRTYFHDELTGLADDYLARSAAYLDRFTEQIGDYPFADFFVISSPLPVGLGFPNLTYVGRRVLPMPFMLGPSLAHEILHNWWGNGVYVDYPRGNWSEGLTTYMADYALAAESGADAARDMRLRWLRDFAALPPGRDFPVAAFTAKSHDADQVVGYNKVAFIFFMLEREIGDAAFAAGLRAFWNQHRFATAGWSDLRRAFEDASGRDLAAFFEQWVNRAGAPVLRLSGARVEERPDGERVTVALGQDAPPYRLNIPLMVETESGREGTIAPLESVATEASIDVDGTPRAVAVDPDHTVFRRLDPSEMPPIFRSVTLDPDAVAIVATADADAADAARRLAVALLGDDVHFAALDTASNVETAAFLVGTSPRIEQAIERLGGGPAPAALAGAATARAWAGKRADGTAFAVVAADDAVSLAATLRALPHYGRMSYLAFRDAAVIDKGVWPVTRTPLRHTFNAR